jgi:hypothetical protein
MQSFLSPAIFLVLLLVFSLSTPPRSLWTPRNTSSATSDSSSDSSGSGGVTDATEPSSTAGDDALAEEVVWVRAKDGGSGSSGGGKCLGPYGFTTCGELSFWLLIPHSSPPSSLPSSSPPLVQYQLQYAPDLFPTHHPGSRDNSRDSSRQCLSQKRYFSFEAAPFLGPCGGDSTTTSTTRGGSTTTSTTRGGSSSSPAASSLWTLAPGGQVFYSYRGRSRCLSPGPGGSAATEPCLPPGGASSPSSPSSSSSASFDIVTHMRAAKVRAACLGG